MSAKQTWLFPTTKVSIIENPPYRGAARTLTWKCACTYEKRYMINIHHLSFVTVFVSLFIKRLDGNCFIYNVKFTGVNFPLNGPVMQKRTQGWEPNTERLYARDGMLIGNNFMALRLEGGGHYTCEFRSTYK